VIKHKHVVCLYSRKTH